MLQNICKNVERIETWRKFDWRLLGDESWTGAITWLKEALITFERKRITAHLCVIVAQWNILNWNLPTTGLHSPLCHCRIQYWQYRSALRNYTLQITEKIFFKMVSRWSWGWNIWRPQKAIFRCMTHLCSTSKDKSLGKKLPARKHEY